jgi:ribosomal protein S18 acetylase RimI-like enzyme
VLQTLLSLVGEQTVTLEVASTNEKAIRLYEKLGFVKTEILRSWYCV